MIKNIIKINAMAFVFTLPISTGTKKIIEQNKKSYLITILYKHFETFQ
jgi:hypothetical protein